MSPLERSLLEFRKQQTSKKTPKKIKNSSKKIYRVGLKILKRFCKIFLIVFTTCAFGQFIIEEALQNYGFGVYVLISNKMWEDASAGVYCYQRFHNSCDKIMKVLAVGNPISAIWFAKFMEADQKKLTIWKNLIEVKIAKRRR